MPPLTARVAPARAEGVSWLRLSLPRGTPPGSYTGTVQIEGREQPIIVDVERDIDLRLFPDALSLAAPPGAVVHVDLSVVNAGNVVCEIRRAYAFGVSVMGGKGPARCGPASPASCASPFTCPIGCRRDTRTQAPGPCMT
ncbi:MAG: hypothetical protein HYY85_08680 [Deltaproteobacteria bacterium]|nr:hypothetical protein [Deltaproteobacteria bacterium]